MTYLEAAVYRAWLDTLPRNASRAFAGCLADAQAWMVLCLGDDSIQAGFVEVMTGAVANVEALRRREEARRVLARAGRLTV